jgi:hypothetical protein
VGVDVYYKRSTDTLDDGQFGQAVVLDQFNYARGFSRGAELKINYYQGGFRAYANLSHEVTMVKDVVSNQYLIGDPVELAYLASTLHLRLRCADGQRIGRCLLPLAQLLASVDGIYGSGLRAGFANEQHSPGYTQWNARSAGISTLARPEAALAALERHQSPRPQLSAARRYRRIGEFAPQYGPRRGVFIGLAQQF